MMKTLGILLFPGFETLDVFGPLEMFGSLPDKIKILLISEDAQLIQSAQGQSVMPDFDLNHAPPLDLLLIPGGMGTRKEIFNKTLLDWISIRSCQAELTLSVCTGAALLACAGVLNGYEATTNKRAFDWVAAQSQQVTWVRHARWIDAGKIITSSGVSAGMDMSLYVISRLFGENTRDEIAKKTEYVANTNPLIDPFGMADVLGEA